MSWVMPEIVVQRVIQEGIKNLRDNSDAFDEIFDTFNCEEMKAAYGQSYIDEIKKWFNDTKIPVVQAWSLNPERIPCFSIHLASEMEDEQKAAIGDFFGETEDSTTATGVFTVYIDIGIHADKSGDGVLWLFYIMSYIMFKEKRTAERLGLKLQTYSASDYNRDNSKLAENIWTRWVRFKCTTQNFITDEALTEVESLVIDIDAQPVGSTDPEDITNISSGQFIGETDDFD
jgi:hypothetical protein